MAAICVFCSSSELIGRDHLRVAADLGSEMARRGHVLVSGGGSVSMMGAVARAARAAGGHTIGVIPRVLLDREVADHDAAELVVVDSIRERKGVMDARSDAFIALAGGIGTLEELFEVWTARTLGIHDKPIVVLDPEGLFDQLRAFLDTLVEQGFVRAAALEAIVWADGAEEAVMLAEGSGAAPTPDEGELLESEP
ncbi:MAG: TIGR00730 family Rossman fold protein [Mycobacteriales bacterium]